MAAHCESVGAGTGDKVWMGSYFKLGNAEGSGNHGKGCMERRAFCKGAKITGGVKEQSIVTQL